MPELPEVETVVRDLRNARLVGRRIVGVRVGWRRTVQAPSVTAFRRSLRGRRVESIWRRGKFIGMTLSGGRTLMGHLRMTGRLSIESPGTARTRHEHLVFALDDGRELRFSDTRKFGRWSLVTDPDERVGDLGPEPLSKAFTGRAFAKRIVRRKGMLKPLLLNQRFIAGLGNIYVDEALWDARLHPRRRSDTLTIDETQRLYRAIRKVLRRGIRSMGTTLGSGETNFYSVSGRRGRNQDRLKVFRRQGQPCPRCGTTLERLVVGQRSTHICPKCQQL